MAITGRGKRTDLRRLEDNIIRLTACGSVDKTLDMLAESLATIASDPGETPNHFDMVIAAVSETDGPRIYYFASYAQPEHSQIPAWTLWDGGDMPMGGGPVPTPEQFENAGLTAEAFKDGLAEPGTKLMELLRTIPGSDPTDPNGKHAYWIGGHIDHAVVTAGGVTLNRLHVWPDRPLHMIQPAQ